MEHPNSRGFPGCRQWIDGSTRGQAAVNTLEHSAPLNWLCTLVGGKLISAQLTIKGLKAQEVVQVELAEGIDGLGLRRGLPGINPKIQPTQSMSEQPEKPLGPPHPTQGCSHSAIPSGSAPGSPHGRKEQEHCQGGGCKWNPIICSTHRQS